MESIVFCILVWVVIYSVINARNSVVVRCRSFTCTHNTQGKCRKGVISVYDNTVKGLCYDHTQDMRERILEPMVKKGMTFKNLESYEVSGGGVVAQKNVRRRMGRKGKPDWWLN